MSHSNVDDSDDNESSCTLLFCFLRLVPLRWRSLTHGEVLCLLDIRLRPPAVDWWPPSHTDCRRRVVSTDWWQRVLLEDRCVTLQSQQNICSCGVILITLSCMCVAGSCYGDRSLSSVTFILPQTVTHRTQIDSVNTNVPECLEIFIIYSLSGGSWFEMMLEMWM